MILFIITACSPKADKLVGVNYVDIVQVGDKISLSYYRTNPLKRESRGKPVRTEVNCRKGRSPTALWVWNFRDIYKNKDRFRNTVHRYGVKRIYLQHSGELTPSVIREIEKLGLEVFLLDGGKDIVLNFPLDRLDYLGVRGLQVDIEPYLNWDFNLKREDYVSKYVDFIRRLKSGLGKKYRLSVVIPFWYDSIHYKGKSLTEHVFMYADEVVVMAYRSSLERVLSTASEEIYLSHKYRKPLWIGVELTPQKDEHHHIYRVSRKKLEFVGSYRVKGDMLVFPHDRAILLKSIKCEGIKGFVLHSYRSIKTEELTSVK